MRRFKKNIRLIAPILSLLFLFYSCNIYKTEKISLEKAADTNRKVRVVLDSGEKLRFKWIEEINAEYFGFTRENSGTSKSLQKLGVIGKERGKFYSFGLETLKIESIQAKNYALSTIATIAVSIVGLFAIMFSIVLATWNDGFPIWEE